MVGSSSGRNLPICLFAVVLFASGCARAGAPATPTVESLVEQIGGPEGSARDEAQGLLIRRGPTVIPRLRAVKTPEAVTIVESYEALMSGDRTLGKQAVEFFSNRKGLLFLAAGLRSTDADVKVSCVRELASLPSGHPSDEELVAVVAESLEALDSATLFVSGSEEATLNDVFVEELVGLLARVTELPQSPGDPIQHRVSQVVSHTAEWLVERKRLESQP